MSGVKRQSTSMVTESFSKHDATEHTTRANDESGRDTQEFDPHADPPSQGCGIMGRYPVLSVLIFAGVGIAVGVGLSFWEPEDAETKDTVLKWIGLIGDLFIRALKCVVLPLVFVNIIIAIVEMMTVGKAGSIGWKTIGLYLLTTVLASIFGIITTLIMKPLYNEGDFGESGPATVALGCNKEGYYMVEGEDGNVYCSNNTTGVDDPNVLFTIEDISGSFARTSSGPASDMSLSDTVYTGVFTKLITSNIVGAFYHSNFAAVVVCAIAFGVALAKVLEQDGDETGEECILLRFLRKIDRVLIIIINWIILVTPFAVLSLITKAIGGQDNLSEAFANVGYLVAATVMAMILQVLCVYIGLYFFVTRTNPLSYFKFLLPAQTMAFACASSAATIPMTLKCVKSTGRVPDSIARFIVPLGATINMDGGAIYFPCACIWLAVLNGIEPTAASYILLVIISTIGSAGTAPVPSASLVLIITAYNTVFNTTGTPMGFSFILAIDWFMDRLRTTMNVTGDAMVTGMVSHLCPLEETDTEEDIDGTGLKKLDEEDSSEANAEDPGESMALSVHA